MLPEHAALFRPLQIKHLTLRNRIMSTSHAPGYAENGRPGEAYQAYHEEKARGGLALTNFGGSSSVSPDSPAAQWSQISVADDGVIPYFQAFADRIHRHGAALMCQITHLGRRSKWNTDQWLVPIAPSPVREAAHRSFPREMDEHDISRVITDFGQAARRCRDGGLDGVEVISSGQHLIGQFLSTATNFRTDRYGGSIENRVRFGLEVFAEIRRCVGEDFIVGFRMSSDEMLEDGLDHAACVDIARRFSASRLVDFFTVSTGQNKNALAMARSIPGMWAEVAPYLSLAADIRRAVDQPVFHAGRMLDYAAAAQAVENGLIDMVGATRAHIADPHLVGKLAAGRADEIRPCVGASYCLERVQSGGASLCIYNAATGRETRMPQTVTPAATSRRIVVVGAGPGGLEAARVCAARGHSVTLFEAEAAIGGQINLAAKATWRRGLAGIVDWYGRELARLGIALRTGTRATASDVLALAPDDVVIATGGHPNLGPFAAHAVSTWDILSGRVAPSRNVLVFDDNGYNQAASCTEFLLAAGSSVELVTADRMVAADVTDSNSAIHLRALYAGGARLTPDHRLRTLDIAGNRLTATLRNEYTEGDTIRDIDQVVVEHGTLPNTDLFEQLRPLSSNDGELDLAAVVDGTPQAIIHNPDGAFGLFRVGDAVAARNVHAAVFDALRLCKEF